MGLTGFEVIDSTLDCGTRGKTKGCSSLSTQGLCEAGLVIATLLSSSEQRNRIYYPWISSDPQQQYCEKKSPLRIHNLKLGFTNLYSPVSYHLHGSKKTKEDEKSPIKLPLNSRPLSRTKQLPFNWRPLNVSQVVCNPSSFL